MDEKKNTTEELKNTSSEEEAKKNLNDEELDKVSGGGAYGELRGEIGNWHFV